MLDLMIPPIVAGLVILSIHAYLGLHVIVRGVIFVDLAFAQIAALGATVGFLMGVEHDTPLALVFSLGFTLVGALIFSFSRLEDTVVPQEAVIGITYVVASAAVILIAGFTAEGAEHIAETLTGTLIWVGWPEIIRMAVIYVILGVIYFIFRKPFLSASLKEATLPRARAWDFLFYVLFGIVITFSVPVAGVLMVFSSLVIPAVVAFLFTSRFSVALWIAWGVGSVTLVTGVVASFRSDIATGPLLVCMFGVAVVVGMLIRFVSGVRPGSVIRP
ncbi:MAG TPA: metal ABC transporter permease [Gemmatimonadetes bacterium]|nr:metal ABC transporter permease [Gemmatimonadota bacterium]